MLVDDPVPASEVNVELPPITEVAKLRKLIALCPSQLRDDAVQEAWLAYCEKRCPCKAVDKFRGKEKAFSDRHLQPND